MFGFVSLLFLFFIPALAFSQEPKTAQWAKAAVIQARHMSELLSKPGVVGVGVGLSETGNGVAIFVYINEKFGRPTLSRDLEGVPVRIVHAEMKQDQERTGSPVGVTTFLIAFTPPVLTGLFALLSLHVISHKRNMRDLIVESEKLVTEWHNALLDLHRNVEDLWSEHRTKEGNPAEQKYICDKICTICRFYTWKRYFLPKLWTNFKVLQAFPRCYPFLDSIWEFMDRSLVTMRDRDIFKLLFKYHELPEPLHSELENVCNLSECDLNKIIRDIGGDIEKIKKYQKKYQPENNIPSNPNHANKDALLQDLVHKVEKVAEQAGILLSYYYKSEAKWSNPFPYLWRLVESSPKNSLFRTSDNKIRPPT